MNSLVLFGVMASYNIVLIQDLRVVNLLKHVGLLINFDFMYSDIKAGFFAKNENRWM